MIRIIWIRHGVTKGNKEKRYVGITDEGLLPEERHILAAKSVPKVQSVYTSPMKRCVETAEILYGAVHPIAVPELRECDFGDFEYHSACELQGNPDYQEWIDSNGSLAFPHGESRKNFTKRCVLGFRKVLEHAEKHQFHTIALVVHGGTIMSVFDVCSNPHQDYFTWQTANGEGFDTLAVCQTAADGEAEIKLEIICGF